MTILKVFMVLFMNTKKYYAFKESKLFINRGRKNKKLKKKKKTQRNKKERSEFNYGSTLC